jgi:hypothetical protein
MDYQPAEGGSEEDEEDEGDVSFHGNSRFLGTSICPGSN